MYIKWMMSPEPEYATQRLESTKRLFFITIFIFLWRPSLGLHFKLDAFTTSGHTFCRKVHLENIFFGIIFALQYNAQDTD